MKEVNDPSNLCHKTIPILDIPGFVVSFLRIYIVRVKTFNTHESDKVDTDGVCVRSCKQLLAER